VALKKIDEWLNTHRDDTPFVLTCRSDEYPTPDPIGWVLPNMPVVRLQAVNREAALAYLGDGAHWAPVRRRFADEGPEGALAEALSSPLMLYLARRISVEGIPGELPLPERLADRGACRDRESIEGMLLDAFIPAAFRDETKSPTDERVSQGRWAAAKAQRWLKFIADRLVERSDHEFGWHRLGRLAPARWQVLPAVFGIVSGLVTAQAARLDGRPTGFWWGITVGTGFATLLWLLGRSAMSAISRGAEVDPETVDVAGLPEPSRAQLVRDGITTGIRVGVFGGLAVGLPGAFFARFLGEWTATVMLGLVAGLLTQRAGAASTPGTGLLTGLIAGPVGWLGAALMCGVPQGAELNYVRRLPGGAAIGALQAWRSAMSFSLPDQLQIAVAFSLAVGIIIGTVIELARSPIGTLIATRRTYQGDPLSVLGAVSTIFGFAGGGAGAAAGAAMAGPEGAVSGLLLGIGFGVAFGPVVLRRRQVAASVRVETLLTSLNLRVRVGLVGGLVGGFVGVWVLQTRLTSCDLLIFVEEAREPVASADVSRVIWPLFWECA
jgi:hypothetical protein